MNENSAFEENGSRMPFTALPLSVLAWLEIQALKKEHASLLQQSDVSDAWYVSSGGETEGPETIAQVLGRLAQGETGFAILHDAQAREEVPPWRVMDHRQWSSDPLLSTVWIILFWALALLVGWIVLDVLLPRRGRVFAEAAFFIGLVFFATGAFSRLLRWKRSGTAEEASEGNTTGS